MSYIRVHAGGITLGTGGVQESQVSTWAHGPHMWVKSRKGDDVLHDHVSKACQSVAY